MPNLTKIFYSKPNWHLPTSDFYQALWMAYKCDLMEFCDILHRFKTDLKGLRVKFWRLISSLDELFAKFIFDDIKLEIRNWYNADRYLDIISYLCETAFVGYSKDEKVINAIIEIFARKCEMPNTAITITYKKANGKFDRVVNINFWLFFKKVLICHSESTK